MNAYAYAHGHALEVREEQELRRKGWLGSLILHGILIVALFVYPRLVSNDAPLTEFTWLEESGFVEEPVDVPIPPVKAAAQDPVIDQPTPMPTSPAKFVREEAEEAVVEPKPQSLSARDDRLSERLTALRENRPNIAVETPKSESLLKTPATEVPKATTEKKNLLRESNASKTPPSILRREQSLSRTPSLATVEPTTNVRQSAVVPPDADLTVRRTLAGAALAGPAADRPVRNYIMPEYPEWAKTEGVEGSVTLGFVVLPDGRVKANVMVHRTSGYQDFDQRAQTALRLWKFEPLPPGSTQEQWGTITMHFRLTS
jgi:TonB family protein